ncbi:MAG: hypothetical protein CL678_09995 [Bdellovibrionaceae bacterium]|nr:hypothetical protein [Pseudobdellovibrionaceae bacterium]|tara:strand:+ start:4193 stop:4486 length:294 start_codon:yes stop_codon:yes gene_type:complete
MDKQKKVALIQRSLGLRHKLKVYDSMAQPESHEDLAIMLMARWELEDELRAVEEMISDYRQNMVDHHKDLIQHGVLGGKVGRALRATKKKKVAKKKR